MVWDCVFTNFIFWNHAIINYLSATMMMMMMYVSKCICCKGRSGGGLSSCACEMMISKAQNYKANNNDNIETELVATDNLFQTTPRSEWLPRVSEFRLMRGTELHETSVPPTDFTQSKEKSNYEVTQGAMKKIPDTCNKYTSHKRGHVS